MEDNKIGQEYIHCLQATYRGIEKRGILVNTLRLKNAATFIQSEVLKECGKIAKIWGTHVYIGADNDDGSEGSVNLNASSGKRTPLLKLQSLGYKIPKISARDEDGNYIQKNSLNELTLQKMLAENQFNILGGDPTIRSLLVIRELSTIQSRYIEANLYNRNGDMCFISNYNVTGTVTGRRASKKHVFNFGNNAQNFPKHGQLAKVYRRCLVARRGKIFLSVDQMQAEDWPVSALASNMEALHDLESGVDRHTKLASMIFMIPIHSKTEQEWKDSIERFLGKKTRHANNYGMRGGTMSDSLAKEGHAVTKLQCDVILAKVNQIDPSVDGVFHAYVRTELDQTRMLKTPFGRERQFFGLRPGETSGNNKIFNEAYCYIPQSVVGDNTGFAVYNLETTYKEQERAVVQEGHDSIVQEIDDNAYSIWEYLNRTRRAFKRDISFHNGITLRIPVEGEISYDFAHTIGIKNRAKNSKKLEDITFSDVKDAWEKLQEHKIKEELTDASSQATNTVD